jgi:hypothetical protein
MNNFSARETEKWQKEWKITKFKKVWQIESISQISSHIGLI